MGDLGGRHALREIGRLLRERGENVVAFYTSNVEFYLMRQGSFENYVTNLASLPVAADGVIIRSYFGRSGSRPLPQRVEGYGSTQLLGSIQGLIEAYRVGRIRSYFDLIVGESLEPKPAKGAEQESAP